MTKILKRLLRVVIPAIAIVAVFGVLQEFEELEPTQVEAQGAWYDLAWTQRKLITIPAAQVPNTDQTDFPVYIDLSDLGADFHSKVKSDGTDIVITSADGTTKLSRELVSIDTATQSGELWFKAPTLSASADSEFYIYYGNPAGAESNSSDVWSNGFRMVQHMDTDPSGTSPQIIDSTSYAINGTSEGSMASNDLLPGKLGNSIDFDGSNDQFRLSNSGQLHLGLPITLSSWVKVRSGAGSIYPIGTDERTTTYRGAYTVITAAGEVAASYGDAGGGFSAADRRTKVNTNPAVGADTWYYFSAVISGPTDMQLYLDAVDHGGAYSGTGGSIAYSSNDALIGGIGQGLFMNGELDEVRVSSVARSQDWIETEFNNQNAPDSFYLISSEEDLPSSSWYDAGWRYRQQITIDATKVANTDQSDFPVYIDLQDMDAAFFAGTKSDGSDIIAVSEDNNTKYSRELVGYRKTDYEGELWVKIPDLSATTDTVFYIYYGNANATETNDTAVWSNGYKLVQHMDQDPSGSPPQILDSTSYNNHGTAIGSMDTADLIAAQIADGYDFDGVDDVIDNSVLVNDIITDTTGAISMWVYIPNATSSFHNLFTVGDTNTNEFLRLSNNAGRIYAQHKRSIAQSWIIDTDNPVLQNNTWHHIYLVHDSTTPRIYVDGQYPAQGFNNSTNPTYWISTSTNVDNSYIGRLSQSSSPSPAYAARFDQTTYSTTPRTANWISTEFNNQSNPHTFYDVGDQVPYTPDDTSAGWYDVNWIHRQKISVSKGMIPSHQYDFPVYINLTDMGIFFFENANTDGSDIIITDSSGTKLLSRDLTHYDEVGTEGEFWFKAERLLSNKNTEFYIYYGNNTANQTNDTSVWSNGYLLVAHLEENPDGTTDEILDSSDSGNNGTTIDVGTTGFASSVTGYFDGQAISFDGVDDKIDFGSFDGIEGSTQLSVSYWSRHSTNDNDNLLTKNGISGFTIDPQSDGSIDHAIAGSTGQTSTPPSTIPLNQWYYVHTSYTSGLTNGLRVYIDGGLQAQSTRTALIPTDSGTLTLAGPNSASGQYFTGTIDEIRVSNIARDANWVSIEYTNQYTPQSFYSITSEETIDNQFPEVTNIQINSGISPIVLTEDTTTTVACTATISDSDGYADITSVEAIFFRTSVGAGATDNENNHYTLTGDSGCIPSNGSGANEDYTCSFEVQFYADATDGGSAYSADDWTCQITPTDSIGVGNSATATTEIGSLISLKVDNDINYSDLAQGTDTGAINATTNVINTGNTPIDVELSGSDMCTDFPVCSGATLPVNHQEYSTSSFTYGSGTDLSSSVVLLDLSLAKSTQSPSNSSQMLYWGIGIPAVQPSGVYNGINDITAVQDS